MRQKNVTTLSFRSTVPQVTAASLNFILLQKSSNPLSSPKSSPLLSCLDYSNSKQNFNKRFENLRINIMKFRKIFPPVVCLCDCYHWVQNWANFDYNWLMEFEENREMVYCVSWSCMKTVSIVSTKKIGDKHLKIMLQCRAGVMPETCIALFWCCQESLWIMMTWILFQLDRSADQGQGVMTKLGWGKGNLKIRVLNIMCLCQIVNIGLTFSSSAPWHRSTGVSEFILVPVQARWHGVNSQEARRYEDREMTAPDQIIMQWHSAAAVYRALT